MKPIRLRAHAAEQCMERGATEEEVKYAVEHGVQEPAKHGRRICRHNFQYDEEWQQRHYAIKQVAAVIVEAQDEIVVVTVYTFYF